MTETASTSGGIPCGMPRDRHAKDGDAARQERRFAASCCGERSFAGFWRRLTAFIIDRIILSFIYLFILLAGGTALMHGIPLDVGALPLATIMDLGLGFAASYYLVLALVNMAYFTYFHGVTGQTPGKMMLGIKVVKVGGGTMTPGIAFLRWVGYLVSGAILGLGFLWVLIDARKQGWHDKIAGTFVVRLAKETTGRVPADPCGCGTGPA